MHDTAVDFLFLSEPDMIRAGVLDMAKCVRVMDEVFQLVGKGDYLMGGPRENEHGLMIWFPEERRFPNMPIAGPDRRFMAMVAYLGGRFNVCGTKWYGSNAENRQRGLPRSILTVLLNDPVTSAPLAILSANLISAMRTGAVPGVAARYLARPGSRVCGVIGAGVINRACLLAIAEGVPSLDEIVVYDIERERAEAFAAEMGKQVKPRVQPVATLEQAVVDSDVISVATSGVKKAAIPTPWLKEGSLLTLTGPAELTDDAFLRNTLVADNWRMHQAWMAEGEEHPKGVQSLLEWATSTGIIRLILEGKIQHEQILNLGDVTCGRIAGRKSPQERIIFVTGGMPVEDVAWGYTVYQEALAKNIGQRLKLWDTPHWS
jgi:N-[(2S)-2-amino-2-carboxyethyl]-L-glutamate dehydrogenase